MADEDDARYFPSCLDSECLIALDRSSARAAHSSQTRPRLAYCSATLSSRASRAHPKHSSAHSRYSATVAIALVPSPQGPPSSKPHAAAAEIYPPGYFGDRWFIAPERIGTLLVKCPDARRPHSTRENANDENSRSRSSRFGAFRGRIGPNGVPQLPERTSTLRLCRSGLVGTGRHGIAWVRATDLHTTTLRADPCFSRAAGRARLLHSAISRAAVR